MLPMEVLFFPLSRRGQIVTVHCAKTVNFLLILPVRASFLESPASYRNDLPGRVELPD